MRELQQRREMLGNATVPDDRNPGQSMEHNAQAHLSQYMNTDRDMKAIAHFLGRHIIIIHADREADLAGRVHVDVVSPYFADRKPAQEVIRPSGSIDRWEARARGAEFRKEDLVLVYTARSVHFNAVARPLRQITPAEPLPPRPQARKGAVVDAAADDAGMDAG